MNNEEQIKPSVDYTVSNTGVLFYEEQETDLVFGANERVKHFITLGDRNWFIYYSGGELQKGIDDTMSCVTFSAIKVVSAIMNYLIRNNKLSQKNLAWLKEKGYINENGQFDASERFTSAMSGTTKNGNTGKNVANSIRNDGLVPQSMCPWNGENGYWFRNPANITQEAKDLGLEFSKRFDILYEIVHTEKLEDVFESLSHSPIQVFIPTSCSYVDTIQQYCDSDITHAVSLCDDIDPRGYLPLFDHYIKQPKETGNEQFIRRVVENYKLCPIAYAYDISEKLEALAVDGWVYLLDKNGRERKIPLEHETTINYLLTNRGFRLK